MAEDWAAVAKAINQRVNELGWRQRELAARSHVSLAIVREIQHNTVQRRRSPRTLESLSVALGWHPQHLDAVLRARTPPAVDEPVSVGEDTVWTRLDNIERQLGDINDRLDDIRIDLSTALNRIRPDR